MEQEETLCGVEELIYLGDRMSAGGGCEASVTARSRSWLMIFI